MSPHAKRRSCVGCFACVAASLWLSTVTHRFRLSWTAACLVNPYKPGLLAARVMPQTAACSIASLCAWHCALDVAAGGPDVPNVVVYENCPTEGMKVCALGWGHWDNPFQSLHL